MGQQIGNQTLEMPTLPNRDDVRGLQGLPREQAQYQAHALCHSPYVVTRPANDEVQMIIDERKKQQLSTDSRANAM
ncbi:MAG: hypothetical protein KC609_17630 [Myxococcales bacterium]|nr:hypothetical protein [Myxococcales bacterium]